MTGVKALISVHRSEMSLLREERRQAQRERKSSTREFDQAFLELRSKLNAEMPASFDPARYRGAVAFMITLVGVFSS